MFFFPVFFLAPTRVLHKAIPICTHSRDNVTKTKSAIDLRCILYHEHEGAFCLLSHRKKKKRRGKKTLMQELKKFRELDALQSDVQAWCLRHPLHCAKLAALLASMGVPNPATLILIMKNKDAVLSLFQYLAKKDKYKQQFRSFLTNQLGLGPQDLVSPQAFQTSLARKVKHICSAHGNLNLTASTKKACTQAQSQLKQLTKFLQPLLVGTVGVSGSARGKVKNNTKKAA